jgi:hypothetical protein
MDQDKDYDKDYDKYGALTFCDRPTIPMANDDVSMADLAKSFGEALKPGLPPKEYVEVARVSKIPESEIPPLLLAAGYAYCMIKLSMSVPPVFQNPPPLDLDQVINVEYNETSKMMHEMFLAPYLEAFRRDRKSDQIYVHPEGEETANSDVVFYMTKVG